ncbi:MAG: hypothetical protein JSR72_21465 [Proteobacteria bacterium]|nr:hypothetical protein [Pseudomonadota bacterium]
MNAMPPKPWHDVALGGASKGACHLRLLADDLTGALDTAAQFSRHCGAIQTFWRHDDMTELPSDAAFDCGTREMEAAGAAARLDRMAAVLGSAPSRLCFLKIDSLLRGNFAVELQRCLRLEPERRVVIAPAFPFQNRVTRDAQQFVADGDRLSPAGRSIRELLDECGIKSVTARPGMAVPSGVSIWDAATDEDLSLIAKAGLATGEPVLWCGSAGLAGALARHLGGNSAAMPSLTAPLYGFFGSDHPVMQAQIEACPRFIVRVAGTNIPSYAELDERSPDRLFFVPDLPHGLARTEAQRHVGHIFSALIRKLPQPATVVVSGGETLRQLCDILAASCLKVIGQWEPGIPCSVLVGGRWPNTTVISKSGAFGDRQLLVRLMTQLQTDTTCH